MPIDPSIILAAGKAVPPIAAPDPLEQYGKSLTLMHLLQQGDLADIQTQNARQTFAEQQGVRDVFKKAAPGSTLEALLPEIYKVSPKTGIEYQGKMLEQKKAQTGIAKDQADIVTKAVAQHRDQLASVNDPQTAAQWVASAYSDPVLKDVVSKAQPFEQAIASIPTDPNAFQQWKQQHALGATKFIELNKPQITTQNLGGTERMVATPGLGGAPTVLNETARTMTPAEVQTGRHQRVMEGQGATRLGLERERVQIAREANGILGEGGALAPESEQMAQAIAAGQLPPLSGWALSKPGGRALMGRVMQINPQYSAQDYSSGAKAVKDFATGKQGNSVRSFNVALSHLDTLGQLADGLKNGDMQVVNRVGNYFASQTGQPAPVTFDAAKKIVADEIVKAIVGSGGGVTDREEAARTIDKANSPAQLKGVINTYKELMKGQLGGLRQQYEQTTNRKDFDRFLSEEGKATSHGAPAAPASAPVRIRGDDGYNALPKGAHYIGPDGVERVK